MESSVLKSFATQPWGDLHARFPENKIVGSLKAVRSEWRVLSLIAVTSWMTF